MREAMTRAVRRLADAGVPSPRADSRALAGHVVGVAAGELDRLTVLGARLTPDQNERFEELVAARADRVPLQHLTGRAPFRTLELAVGPGVFVPRPETELTAQLAIDELARLAGRPEHLGSDPPVMVDLCTGSGAIALAVAAEVPGTIVYAVELSPEALAWARRNVERTGLGVHLVAGDAREDLCELAGVAGRVDVLTCNPPYIPPQALPIDREVRDHDPELALYGGGRDGLDRPRELARRALDLVRPGGLLVMEHADGKGNALTAALHDQGWTDLTDHLDLTGRSRSITARAPAPGTKDGLRRAEDG